MSELTVRKDGTLAEFEPEQARTAITAYNAAAEVARRKGNIEEACELAESALAIQRGFVLWWDSQDKDRGGHASLYAGNRSVTGSAELPLDIDKMTVSRWRKLVGSDPNDTSAYERSIVQARAKILRSIEGKSDSVHVEQNSGENEWYTPAQYIDAARDVMGGIDLDPASSAVANQVIKAPKYFDKHTNGLDQEWAGRVWLNPPYAQPLISQFVTKTVAEVMAGNVDQAIVLVNNGTETEWGQSLLAHAKGVCFPKGRIQFVDQHGEPGGAPLQGQMFVYFGSDYAAFRDRFCQYGLVLQ